MKRSELLFNLISIPVDIAALATAGVVSFYIREHGEKYVGKIVYALQLHDFLLVVAKVTPVLLIVFALFGLYNLRGTRRFIHEFNRIFIAVSFSMLLVIVLFFFRQSIFPSRFIILSAWVLSIIFVLVGRLILKLIQEMLFNRGYGLHRLVVINGRGFESELIQSFLQNRSHGYEVIAELHNSDSIIGELEELYQTASIDEIIQANTRATSDQNLLLVEFARNKGLQFSFVPNLFEVQRNVIELNNFRGVPVISLKNTPLDGWGKVAKRVLDIVASSLCLIITAPLFLAIYIAIRLDSPGAAIYSHMRDGRNRKFEFYKFRSMYSHLSTGEKFGSAESEKMLKELIQKSGDEDRSGPLYKIKNDPRVTKVGRFIRRTKLDELPQFWNVLKGDMSMIGPRPHLPDQVQLYRNTHGRIFSIKPGIFGLTQIAQTTWPTLPFEEEIRLDTYYIENWSLWWDIKIMIKSAYMLFFVSKPKEDY